MKYDLDFLRSSVLIRLKDPSLVLPGAVDVSINEGLAELCEEILRINPRHLDRVVYRDLVKDKDIVSMPADVEEVVLMERLDLGAAAVPIRHEHFRQRDPDLGIAPFGSTRSGIYTWTELDGGRILLKPKPTADTTDGLRITYTGEVPILRDGTDQPPLPSRLQEFIVVMAVERIRHFAGITLADVRGFELWAANQRTKMAQAIGLDPAGPRRISPVPRYTAI